MKYLANFLKETGITLIIGALFLSLIAHFRPMSDEMGIKITELLIGLSIQYGIFQTFGYWLFLKHPQSKLRMFFWTSQDIFNKKTKPEIAHRHIFTNKRS